MYLSLSIRVPISHVPTYLLLYSHKQQTHTRTHTLLKAEQALTGEVGAYGTHGTFGLGEMTMEASTGARSPSCLGSESIGDIYAIQL